ncbi:hypothetical protein OXX69_005557 [Metschnikowia pulcherrima]
MYVDDLLIISCDQEAIAETERNLSAAFKTKDLGIVKKFLGINVEITSTHTKIHLGDYIKSMLENCGFDKIQHVSIPASKVSLDTEVADEEDHCDESEYRSIVGKLLYAANTERFDIGFIVSKLSRYLISPKYKHLEAAQRVLRYLKGTAEHGIIFRHGSTEAILSYCDAGCNLAMEPESRSFTGSIILHGGSSTGWKSKLQTMVALSTVNAEQL